jgi:hypothetical protein
MLREGFLSSKRIVVGVLHALVNLMKAGRRSSIRGSGFGVECGGHCSKQVQMWEVWGKEEKKAGASLAIC